MPGVSVPATAPMLPSSSSGGHSYPSKKPWWHKITRRYDFDSEDLEAIYQRYIFKLRLSSVVALLVLIIILTATLAILNFLFVSSVTVENIYHIAQCVIFFIILVYIHTKYMKEKHLLVLNIIILFLCICFSIIALPVDFGDRPDMLHTPANGVWQITLVVFLIYALMPLRIYIAVAAGIALPLAHIVVSVIMAQNDPMLLWRQVCHVMSIL